MGASFLLETQDISSSLFFWRKSIELRTTTIGGDIEKPKLGPHPVLGTEEFRTEQVKTDNTQCTVATAILKTASLTAKQAVFKIAVATVYCLLNYAY